MSINNPLAQAISLLIRAQDKAVSTQTLEAHFSAGLISDMFEVKDPTAVDREAFRKLLGLSPLAEEIVKKTWTLVFRKQDLLGTTRVVIYGLGKPLMIAQMLRVL